MLTRRRLLGNTAKLTAAAMASSLLPPNVRRALARPTPPASMRQIKHVVLLMQENRSFDHYFGTMAGVRGFDDPNPHMLSTGKSVFHQPDALSPGGYLLPFHLDTRRTNAQKIPSTSHAWSVQHDAWNNGKMDRWLPAHRKADGEHGPFVMGYYTRQDIPFQFALAEAFTICDAYHCSVMGPTWPNRMYWMTATIDPEGRGGGPIIKNTEPVGGFTWTTYAERLEKAGISWKVYQEKDNFGCNPLELFKPFIDAPKGSALHKKGMERGPRGQFEYDAINDKLPTVSWVITTSHESEHPDYMPAAGAAFVASKIDAIAANPEVWAKTALILNYDENDGIFDHVVPPTPPPGTPGEYLTAEPLGRRTKGKRTSTQRIAKPLETHWPVGAGFRVPCIIVSPWTAGGWVCSEPFDHTSVIQFLEKFTGVHEPNITDWRRKTFGDLTSTFRFQSNEAKAPVLPDTAGQLSRAIYEAERLPKPKVPLTQSMPQQESGKRPHVPEET